MIKEVTMYACTCDVCGVQWSDGDGIVAYTDISSIEQVVMDSDWEITDKEYLCPNCWEWSEDGEKIIPKQNKVKP